MAMMEGWWIAPDGKVLEIRDHFEEVRSDPKRFGFSPQEAETWKREDRTEVLKRAMRNGWVRVRGHRTHMTFELDRLTEDSAARIRDFLVKVGAWETEPIEVHELGTGRSWHENAGFFLEERHLAMLGAKKTKGRVVRTEIPVCVSEAMTNERFLRDLDFRPNGETIVVRSHGEPAGIGRVARARRGPGPDSLVGSFLLGLSSGFGPDEKFTPEQVRDDVMEAFPQGGTLTLQLGWFKKSREDSVRVLIENSGMGMSDDEFMDAMGALVDRLVEKYRQQEIWVDYYRGPEKVDSLTFKWET